MPFSMSVTGLDEAASGIASIAQTLKPNITAQVDQVFSAGMSQMQRDCPVKTGYLKSSIGKKSGSGNILAEIEVTAGYALPVNDGHGNTPPKPFATNAYNFILSELKRINIASK